MSEWTRLATGPGRAIGFTDWTHGGEPAAIFLVDFGASLAQTPVLVALDLMRSRLYCSGTPGVSGSVPDSYILGFQG